MLQYDKRCKNKSTEIHSDLVEVYANNDFFVVHDTKNTNVKHLGNYSYYI